MRDYDLRSAVMTMIHEVFHALGLFYEFPNCYVDSSGNDNTSNIFDEVGGVRYFKGPQTLSYLNTLLGCSSPLIEQIPLEDQGGSGTSNYHWE